MLATYTINFFSFPITIGVAALIFPAIYPLSDSITEVYGKKTHAMSLPLVMFLPVIISFINNGLLAAADNHHYMIFC